MDYAIETISLTKIFSDWWGRAKVYAVDDLNLQVQPNEVIFVHLIHSLSEKTLARPSPPAAR